MNVKEFAKEYYSLYHPECGDLGLEQVICAVRRLETQMERPVDTSELSEELILSHLKWMREAKLANGTRRRRRSHLMAVWRLAYKKRLNQNDPGQADIPKVAKTTLQPIAWSIANIETMLEQAGKVKNIQFSSKCWTSLIWLLCFTGIRIKCALSLKRTSLKGHILFVPHDIQKDKEDQVFRLPSDLVNLLVSLPRPEEDCHGRKLSEMLIPWPWRVDSAQKQFARYILKPAGLPLERKLKFHALRKTTATIVSYHKGEEAARKVMGHSSVEVTRRYIADPSSVDPKLDANFSPVDVMPRLGTAG